MNNKEERGIANASAKALCKTIAGFYKNSAGLPAELEELIIEWILEGYAIGETYQAISRFCDELINGTYPPRKENKRISEVLNIQKRISG